MFTLVKLLLYVVSYELFDIFVLKMWIPTFVSSKMVLYLFENFVKKKQKKIQKVTYYKYNYSYIFFHSGVIAFIKFIFEMFLVINKLRLKIDFR